MLNWLLILIPWLVIPDPRLVIPDPRTVIPDPIYLVTTLMLRSLKIRAQEVKSKFATKICLAERKAEVRGKWPWKKIKTRKALGALDPAVSLPSLGVQNTLRSLKIWAQVVQIFEVGDLSYLWRVCCTTYLFGRAKTGGLGHVTTKKIIMKKHGYY